MAAIPNQPRVVKFGVFEVDLQAGEVRKAGMRQKLAGQPFQVLQALLEHPQEIVTREELRERIWPGNAFIDYELALKKAVNRLRELLGDSAESPHFIETVPRRGYRFLLPVTGRDGNGQTRASDGAVIISQSKQGRKIALVLTIAMLVSGVSAVIWVTQRVPNLKVAQYVRLTKDGRDKSGNLSEGIPSPIVTDGTHLYFVESRAGATLSGLVQVSATGGDTLPIITPFQNVRLTDISPDRTHLLVGNANGPTAVEVPFYSLPTVGGTARRLGDFLAHDASWSPSGLNLAYATGDTLCVAKPDGTASKKLVSGLGAVWWPRWSPDGSRLRFTVAQPGKQDNTIWEIAIDGTHLRELSLDWGLSGDKCCGSWTPDGKYFLFQSSQLGVVTVWAIPERGPLFRKARPTQLASGPLWASAPAISADGKKLFFIGWQPRTEAIRYEREHKRFISFLPENSVDALDFTRDGRWIAYTQYPEGSLWRARADGAEGVQLTPGTLYAFRPRWSPDGTNIVFFGPYLNRPWKLYLLPANGGTPTQLISGDANEGDPTWSPDGTKLAFGRLPWMPGAAEKIVLFILDLSSRRVTPLPGSDGLFSPRWSPSGRYIVALSADSTRLMLYDFQTNNWRQLAQAPLGNPEWSHDEASVYAFNLQGSTVVRIRVSDGRIEPVANLNAERIAFTGLGPWTGLGPDDSVLSLRDLSTQEIYSAELKNQ